MPLLRSPPRQSLSVRARSPDESLDMETVFSGEDGNGEPYLVSESYPEVVGVVVLAEGSGTGSVDYDILNAVQVLFDIPAHKIKIQIGIK